MYLVLAGVCYEQHFPPAMKSLCDGDGQFTAHNQTKQRARTRYRGVFEPHAEWEDERGVVDEYFALQLDAFYDEFLPAVERHFAALDKAVPSVLKFDFPREEVFDLIENYICLLYTSPSPRDRG